ncbi:type 1 periplasmic-binding domain-containing protein [Micromonospora sagamiensis]|uniref:Substrate-binding family protein n=1 Tax=Micromonospora sagamiensis TaxID=47875 RepID=A0A562WF82_9ACTN|nr:hypothetical protein [Micromonospora sagamiensis]TWJ28537.1 hypothetical protein JD81_02042 [Micromonospora sagamiensis]BCL12562.1 hypothetical protein GCM10017556_03010 [Micromonospora sagamiensis]
MRPRDTHRTDVEAGRSPLVDPAEREAYGQLPPPVPHTAAELGALIGLLTVPRSRITTVVVGRSRDAASVKSAAAFTEAWEARGGAVLAAVDWPETAASWLRAARRMTAETPDAWVIAAATPGFVQLARRLRNSTAWEPSRAYAFGSLCDSRLPALAGPGVVDRLRGASADGGTWEVRGRWVTMSPGRTSG